MSRVCLWLGRWTAMFSLMSLSMACGNRSDAPVRRGESGDANQKLLRVEETKLREMTARRASLAAPRPRRSAEAVSDPARIRALFSSLATLLVGDPDVARQALAEAFEPLVLRPRTDGEGRPAYSLEMPLKDESRPV